MQGWSDHFVSVKLEDFWNLPLDEKKSSLWKEWQSETAPAKPRVLIAGNGLSRLGKPKKPRGAGVSWTNWLRNNWRDEEIGVRFDVAAERLSEPELLSYMIGSYSRNENTKLAEPELLESLRKEVEDRLDPSEIHGLCLDFFDVIVTTNYDTLFERACFERDCDLDIRIVEVTPNAPPYYDIKSVNLAGRRAGIARQKTRVVRLVKYHGSFPIFSADRLCRYSGGDDTLATSFSTYRFRNQSMSAINGEIKKFVLAGVPDGSHPGLVLLGHGLSFSDMSLSHLISTLEPRLSLMLEFGGDEIDKHRAVNDWGLTRQFNVPLTLAGGPDFRARSTKKFICSLSTRAAASTTAVLHQDYALLIGQASVGYVFRTERPIAEHSHAIHGSYFREVTDRQRKRAGELIHQALTLARSDDDKRRVKDWEREWTTHRFNVRQPQGQVLTPALLLEEWGINSVFASIVGADRMGKELRRFMDGLEHVDTRSVRASFAIDRTDHSYVAAFGGMRTLFDHNETGEFSDTEALRDDAEALIADLRTRILAGARDGSGKGSAVAPLGVPKVVYLSKWLLRQSGSLIKKLGSLSARPLFVYETGSTGAENPEMEREVLGDFCDVVLASPIMAMKLVRAPVAWPRISDAHDQQAGCFSWPKSRGDVEPAHAPCDIDVGAWRKEFAQHQPNANPRVAFHHVLFLVAIAALGPGYLARCLFAGSPLSGRGREQVHFPACHAWVVTAGEFGMFILSKPQGEVKAWEENAAITWVRGPRYDIDTHGYDDLKVLNTLGCGDVARGAFIGRFMKDDQILGDKEKLKDPELLLACVRAAVTAGKERARRFELVDAIQSMEFAEICKDADKNCSTERIDSKSLSKFADEVRRIYLRFLMTQDPKGRDVRQREADERAQLEGPPALPTTIGEVSRELLKIKQTRGGLDFEPLPRGRAALDEEEEFEKKRFGERGLLEQWQDMREYYERLESAEANR